MSFADKSGKKTAKWNKLICKKLAKAQKADNFKIVRANEDMNDLFYIKLSPKGGHYRDQDYFLEFKTQYYVNDGKNKVLKKFPFDGPPRVKFVGRIPYHPNISKSGTICVDILTHADKWSVQYDFELIIQSIILLMDTPNNASPYNSQAAGIFRKNEKLYKEFVKNNPRATMAECDEKYNKLFAEYDELCLKHSKLGNVTELQSMFS